MIVRAPEQGSKWRRECLARMVCATMAACAVIAAVPARAAPSVLFDKPVKVVRHALPHDPDNPQAKAELRCSYYPHFMVKEIDLGEPGADQLSILPIAAGKSRDCKRANASDEIVVKEWSGYLGGVKGEYIFWDADDGWNGGLGFAVTTADGKKLFDDVAKTAASPCATRASMAHPVRCARTRRAAGARSSSRPDSPIPRPTARPLTSAR